MVSGRGTDVEELVTPAVEKRRLAALRRLGLLDTPKEERFERLTRIAVKYYGVKSAFFALVGEDRQWFKSAQGVAAKEIDRSIALCDFTIRQDGVFIVEDATEDPRFSANPLVTGGPKIRFYAGIPVRESSGLKVGTFCIVDDKPRKIKSLDLDVLKSLASIVEEELERLTPGARPTELVEASGLGRAIQRAQNVYLTSDDKHAAFELMLEDLLALTESEFGFIGEVLKNPQNQPYLKIGAITNIAWSPETEALFQQVKRRGLIFDRLDNLLGLPLVSEEVVVSNAPATDPRRQGLPPGHPPLESFIAMPVHSGNEYIGLIGLANRDGGFTEQLADDLAPLVQTLGTLIERNRLHSEKRVHQQKLETAAYYDELTGLPNRRRLTELFELELAEAQARDGRVSVCFLDLDGFKQINDDHGHEVGDAVLKSVASRLTAVLREDDIVSRLGGDEFVAILRDVQQESIYRRILEAIDKPIGFRNSVLRVSGSMGVAVYPDDDSDSDLLIRHADQAMYAAKDAGKNCFKVFDVKVHQSRKQKSNILEQLDSALALGQLEMYFQPKIDFQARAVLGFEALIRWNHPDSGLLAPAHFLEHLEHTEYAAAVGRFVLRDAVKKLVFMREQNLPYSISVNLSPSHFLGRQFVSDLAQALGPLAVKHRHRLVLEMLETTALNEAAKVIKTLKKCRELGVQISLDDFGTGVSSLDHFRRLPVDEIKIDRSFVMDMLEDKEDEVIVGAIVGLTRSFSRRAIAEGVEDAETAGRLIELGCEYGQGFFYSRPIPFDEALEWARTFKWRDFQPR